MGIICENGVEFVRENEKQSEYECKGSRDSYLEGMAGILLPFFVPGPLVIDGGLLQRSPLFFQKGAPCGCVCGQSTLPLTRFETQTLAHGEVAPKLNFFILPLTRLSGIGPALKFSLPMTSHLPILIPCHAVASPAICRSRRGRCHGKFGQPKIAPPIIVHARLIVIWSWRVHFVIGRDL
jgi:hypothetical protein